MKQTLQLRVGQQLTLTPQLQQAIKLLQLSQLDLEQEISAAVENNPLLEYKEDKAEDLKENKEKSQLENNWENNYPDFNQNYQQNSTTKIIESTYCEQDSLSDYLEWQINLMPLSDRDKKIALTIIDSINTSGYLEASIEELQKSLTDIEELASEEILMVLHQIQHLDPLGVGARNLKECLTIQLNALPKNTEFLKETQRAVKYYLELLSKKNLARLKSRMGIKLETANGILNLIKKLNPNPAQNIYPEKTEYIQPDLMVKKYTNEWIVALNIDFSQDVQLNTEYADILKQSNNKQDQKFLQEHINNAKWFLKSLYNRNDTLLRVGKAIMQKQEQFLEYGEEKMQPLILQDIAAELDLHESTISRITTNKYIHTPRGVYELKYFFSSQVSNSGNNCSSTAIKALIRNIISQEDKTHPLSDNKITTMLSTKGIMVARRTVTKYREAMNIPISGERKK